MPGEDADETDEVEILSIPLLAAQVEFTHDPIRIDFSKLEQLDSSPEFMHSYEVVAIAIEKNERFHNIFENLAEVPLNQGNFATTSARRFQLRRVFFEKDPLLQ